MVSLSIAKLFILWQRQNTFDLLSWIFFSAIWIWVGWGYWKDKDMPAYVGNFRYNDGKNQLARTIFVVSMIVCFLIGFIGY